MQAFVRSQVLRQGILFRLWRPFFSAGRMNDSVHRCTAIFVRLAITHRLAYQKG